jgi:hypothetical protein
MQKKTGVRIIANYELESFHSVLFVVVYFTTLSISGYTVPDYRMNANN